MLYYITLTTRCNLRCSYCGGFGEWVGPTELSVPLSDIKAFLSSDPEAVICFYGGEPLLRIDLIEEILREIPARRFVIQTNGLLLDRLSDEALERIDAILVSIDGRRETTDYYRGRGVYDRVLGAVRRLRRRGFRGELIARMAVSGKSDIYREVTHLLGLGVFDYVHWQLDALWDYPPAQRYDDFGRWVDEVYNPGITMLVEYWVDELVRGRLRGIVPFMGIMHTLLTGERPGLRCGAGVFAFSIFTDGRVLACPIAPEFRFNVLGDIWSLRPEQLPNRIGLGEPCTSCSYLWVCGGRCLFANRTKLWGEEGFKTVCRTVVHLVNELARFKGDVEALVREGVFSTEDFRYPKYPNSVEVIP